MSVGQAVWRQVEGCSSPLHDYSVIVSPFAVFLMPQKFWNGSNLRCGSKFDLLGRESHYPVLCWSCALSLGFVNKELEQHAVQSERKLNV
jgi:hypothetical protein